MAHKDLKIVAPLLEQHLANPIATQFANATVFTPLDDHVKERLFYTPNPNNYSFDKRLSFLPSFKNTPSFKRKLKTEKLRKCEALARITLILQKYQRWIRKKKCIVEKWEDDSDSDSDDSDSESDSDEMDDEEAMNLAIFQQFAYGNNSMIEKIKKNEIYNWINKELSANYNEGRLLEDYLHLRHEHKDEYEQIHNHLCDALDKQIKPSDNFRDTYIQYQSKKLSASPYNVEINIEQLLDEIQLYFAGIFEVDFFHQKYKVMKLIGTGIEGTVHKVKLRHSFDSFILCRNEKKAKDPDECLSSSASSSEEDEDDAKRNSGAQYYAAKTIDYNERTMNNYRVMAKFDILDEFELYIDKKNDKLILVSEFWDSDVFDYMREEGTTFNEEQLYTMMRGDIIPLLFKLHSNHYIHGDIKPNNFVMNVGPSEEYENEYGLIDFGTMLKMNERSETIRSSLIGSMGYYAPEIMFEMYDGPVKIDTKCDIWALGLTFIFLLTGAHPLESDDLNILGERKIKIKIDKCLTKMNKTNKISQDLMDLLTQMLQIEPLKRYNLYQIQHHKWITKEENVQRILFLDIDGVLNDSKSRPKSMQPHLLIKLKKIINLSNCKIVLCSSWRRVPELKRKFKKQFKKIVRLDIATIYIGDTPCNGKNPTRVHEIMEYFEHNDHKDANWCVVDDMDLVNENAAFSKECQAFVKGHWVQPNRTTGLTDHDVHDIVQMLNPANQINI